MTAPSQSLKKLFLRGSAWTLTSVGAIQVIRLGKSLILSRLLFPDTYGVMAIVWSVLFSINMLSDVGIAACVIRSARGDEENFLNTAWTMKVTRGALIFFVASFLSYPLANFYSQPSLIYLIPVAAITTLIDGFSSTNIYSNQRSMNYSRTTTIDLSTEIVGMIATLLWAHNDPSVWALIGGALAASLYRTTSSHLFLPGIRNKFHWDISAKAEIFHFGKWIFLSSALYLLYSQGDKLILGVYLSLTSLGIYAIAILLSEAVSGVINKLNDGVLYPAVSRIVNTNRPRLGVALYQARLGTDILIGIPVAILMVNADLLVQLLYDLRYHEAGWMFQILCLRLLMMSVLVGGTSCLFALGQSRYSLYQNFVRSVWVLCGIPFIWPLYGLHGVIGILATTEVPVALIVWFGLSKYGIYSVKNELRSVVFIIIGLVLGFAIRNLVSN